VADEPRQPAGRDDGVVVEEHQHLARRQRKSLVVCGGKAAVGVIQDDPNAAVHRRKFGQVIPRPIGGAIVDDDELVFRRGGVGEQTRHTQLRKDEVVVGDDDDAGQRRLTSTCTDPHWDGQVARGADGGVGEPGRAPLEQRELEVRR